MTNPIFSHPYECACSRRRHRHRQAAARRERDGNEECHVITLVLLLRAGCEDSVTSVLKLLGTSSGEHVRLRLAVGSTRSFIRIGIIPWGTRTDTRGSGCSGLIIRVGTGCYVLLLRCCESQEERFRYLCDIGGGKVQILGRTK